MENKLDIKSTTIEKGIEIAKDFVDKLVMPSIEETGLLVKDQITMWRFKNQIKMLNKAKEYCDKHKIEPKKISLKILAPLLEYSSLEENNEMQDKWSILLTNLIDSKQNIENHVFPYILSQLSKDEFFTLEKVYENCILRRDQLSIEIINFRKDKPSKIDTLNLRLQEVKEKIKLIEEKESNIWNTNIWKFKSEKRDIERAIKDLDYEESKIRHAFLKYENVPEENFKDFEISNLVRLGLIKEIKEFFAESQTLEIPLERDIGLGYTKDYANVDLDIDVESITEFILTELGELFFKACKEKNQ